MLAVIFALVPSILAGYVCKTVGNSQTVCDYNPNPEVGSSKLKVEYSDFWLTENYRPCKEVILKSETCHAVPKYLLSDNQNITKCTQSLQFLGKFICGSIPSETKLSELKKLQRLVIAPFPRTTLNPLSMLNLGNRNPFMVPTGGSVITECATSFSGDLPNATLPEGFFDDLPLLDHLTVTLNTDMPEGKYNFPLLRHLNLRAERMKGGPYPKNLLANLPNLTSLQLIGFTEAKLPELGDMPELKEVAVLYGRQSFTVPDFLKAPKLEMLHTNPCSNYQDSYNYDPSSPLTVTEPTQKLRGVSNLKDLTIYVGSVIGLGDAFGECTEVKTLRLTGKLKHGNNLTPSAFRAFGKVEYMVLDFGFEALYINGMWSHFKSLQKLDMYNAAYDQFGDGWARNVPTLRELRNRNLLINDRSRLNLIPENFFKGMVNLQEYEFKPLKNDPGPDGQVIRNLPVGLFDDLPYSLKMVLTPESEAPFCTEDEQDPANKSYACIPIEPFREPSGCEKGRSQFKLLGMGACDVPDAEGEEFWLPYDYQQTGTKIEKNWTVVDQNAMFRCWLPDGVIKDGYEVKSASYTPELMARLCGSFSGIDPSAAIQVVNISTSYVFHSNFEKKSDPFHFACRFIDLKYNKRVVVKDVPGSPFPNTTKSYCMVRKPLRARYYCPFGGTVEYDEMAPHKYKANCKATTTTSVVPGATTQGGVPVDPTAGRDLCKTDPSHPACVSDKDPKDPSKDPVASGGSDVATSSARVATSPAFVFMFWLGSFPLLNN